MRKVVVVLFALIVSAAIVGAKSVAGAGTKVITVKMTGKQEVREPEPTAR
jgi:hypothetical protein